MGSRCHFGLAALIDSLLFCRVYLARFDSNLHLKADFMICDAIRRVDRGTTTRPRERLSDLRSTMNYVLAD
jgi:hypothetical protein